MRDKRRFLDLQPATIKTRYEIRKALPFHADVRCENVIADRQSGRHNYYVGGVQQ